MQRSTFFSASAFCFAWILGVLILYPAQAQEAQRGWSLGVRPHVAANEEVSVQTLGIRYEGSAFRRSEHARGGFQVHLASAGSFLREPALNTVPLFLDLSGGLWVTTYRPDTSRVEGPIDPDADTPFENERYYGRFDASAAARYETNQPFDDQNLTFGLVLGYVYTRGLNPAVVVALDGVFPLKAETREALFVDEEGFLRLRIDATLTWPFGGQVGPEVLAPLGLHLGYAFNHEFGAQAAWKAADLDQARYLAATLGYGLRHRLVKEVYLGVAHGRVPPSVYKETTFRVGVLFGRGGA